MRLFERASDGGDKSGVAGFFLVEIKPLFSIVLLRFNAGTREAFHSHAFNALTWFVRGRVQEHRINPLDPSNVTVTEFGPSLKPKYTPRDNHHKVVSLGVTWALSLRGPWLDTWREYRPADDSFVVLTHGREEVSSTHA